MEKTKSRVLKFNVNVFVFLDAQTFAVGTVLRDYLGMFIASKNLCYPEVSVRLERLYLELRINKPTRLKLW